MSTTRKSLASFYQLEGDALDEKLSEMKRSLFDLRVGQATGQLEKPSRLRQVRRDIARLQTVRRQKETGNVPAAKPEAKTSKGRSRKTSEDKG